MDYENTVAEFVKSVAANLPPEVCVEFNTWERRALQKALFDCQMWSYPPVSGNPDGERASGQCLCMCGRQYAEHPTDWRVVGYNNRPFLNVLCDGRRVKL